MASSTGSSSARLSESLIAEYKRLIPPLDGSNYKGQHGKVAVMGGCKEYTGAPYFAAMSSLKVGADMAYVICTSSSGPVIKGYSPELMVLPYVPEMCVDGDKDFDRTVQDAVDNICRWLPKTTVLVVGPGLGDDEMVCVTAEVVIEEARQANVPLLVDGSGLNMIAKNPELVKGYTNCILTPNVAELGRLAEALGIQLEGKMGAQWTSMAGVIAAALQGPVVIAKGPADVITDGHKAVACEEPASSRRCGGQGDVLAGAVAAFMCWAAKQQARVNPAAPIPTSTLMACALGGCTVMRRASMAAYLEAERSMLAEDVIRALPKAFVAVQER